VILCLSRTVIAEKIVFLGDSITDGHTYPQLIAQALKEAKIEVPTIVNAGIGGDTAAGMLKRLDCDVFVHKPTLMTLSAGINDSGRVSPADFERDVTAIVDQVTLRGVKLVILTTSIQGKGREKNAARALEYDAILRKLAASHHAPVADVKALMTAARDRGESLLEEDQVHPNFAGQSLIARAVLDALGHPTVAVPKALNLQPMPGLIADWHIRSLADKEKPDPATLAIDATWKSLHLPLTDKEPTWWRDDERRRGFALSLDKTIAPAKHFIAVTTVTSQAPRRAYLNTGAQLEALWLNGKQIYQNKEWTGWHAGKERIAVDLPAGRSTLILQSGDAFFLSLTDDNQW
jgi:lysophospholipase L1-like esterase